MHVSPRGSKVQILVDCDEGITIEQCTNLASILYQTLDAEAILGDVVLEVSSPGIGNPFRLKRQYTKSIGKLLSLKMNDGSEKQGVLQSVQEETFTIALSPDKKTRKALLAEPVLIPIAFSEVEEAIELVVFKKRRAEETPQTDFA